MTASVNIQTIDSRESFSPRGAQRIVTANTGCLLTHYRCWMTDDQPSLQDFLARLSVSRPDGKARKTSACVQSVHNEEYVAVGRLDGYINRPR